MKNFVKNLEMCINALHKIEDELRQQPYSASTQRKIDAVESRLVKLGEAQQAQEDAENSLYGIDP